MFIDIHAHTFKIPFLQMDGLVPFPAPSEGIPNLMTFLIEMKDSGKISLEKFNKIARGNAIRLLNL